ncbi:hypothetical protein HK101_008029 [Irineochytrium annulatum]|nr:hypothetical protein HK101_008029 [Irineochytrium annulatum]
MQVAAGLIQPRDVPEQNKAVAAEVCVNGVCEDYYSADDYYSAAARIGCSNAVAVAVVAAALAFA